MIPDGGTMVVDGIRSRVGGTWVREIFQFVQDHPDSGHACYFCRPGNNAKEAMHWVPGDPIVRFTSEGLQSNVS